MPGRETPPKTGGDGEKWKRVRGEPVLPSRENIHGNPLLLSHVISHARQGAARCRQSGIHTNAHKTPQPRSIAASRTQATFQNAGDALDDPPV